MSRENVEIVRGQFEAVNRRDWAAVMAHYDRDIVLVVKTGVPNPGTFSGQEAVGAWFGDWFLSFGKDYRFELEEIVTAGDRVLVVQRHHGTGRMSGIELEMANVAVFTLRESKIVRLELYASRTDVVEALSLGD